ncbi:MAG: MoaD/ThiS family protein [Synechococcaceae cyanobacterium]|nr:MoaD/ThiS family protein [Synechococcaceae cyanobacterium]
MTTPAGPMAEPIAAPITVRLFGALREAHGWSRRALAGPARPPGAAPPPTPTPGSIWRELDLGRESLPAGVRVAVNHRFAQPDTPLQPGDEVAFLPPISGG